MRTVYSSIAGFMISWFIADSAHARNECPVVTVVAKKRCLVPIFVSVLVAFGGCSSGTDATSETVQIFDTTVATVTMSLDTWDANRIGQRQQLTATAMNASGDTISGVQFTWESSATGVASVDASGLVTVYSAGHADVTATADGKVGMTALTVTSEVESEADGIMYTVWFARSDDAPALLVDGELEVAKDIYCQNNDEDWVVCPPDVDFPDEYSNDPSYKHLYPNPPDPTTPWSYPDVAKFQWKGDRIGILSDMFEGRGTFRVLERRQEWTILALANAKDFQLSNQLTAVLIDDGASQVNALRVKAGTFGPFRLIASGGVRQFQIEDDYIGVLFDDGLFRMKKGLDSPDWNEFAVPGDGVREFAMELYLDEDGVTRFRVGEIFENGSFRVKDELQGQWTTLESGGVQEFRFEGNHIGVRLDDGTIKIKKGINGGWALLAGSGAGVKDFAMQELTDGNGVRYARVAILFDDGLLRVKDGIFSPDWDVSTGVQRVKLQENYIGALLADGTLSVKEGIFGGWRETVAYGTGVTQIQLIVDVPVPPARTWPSLFDAKRLECFDQGTFFLEESGPCYPIRTDFLLADRDGPTAYYGRFAGADIPGPRLWDWAVDPERGGGPLDPMDALTMHHDAAYKCPDECATDPEPSVGWYPEDDVSLFGAYLCVVRYGLEFAQLTENGVPIDISQSDRSTWGLLGDLYGTIYSGPTSYWTGSKLGCPDRLLVEDSVDAFAEKTKAKHNNE